MPDLDLDWMTALLAYCGKNTDRTFDAKNRNAGAGDQTHKFISNAE